MTLHTTFITIYLSVTQLGLDSPLGMLTFKGMKLIVKDIILHLLEVILDDGNYMRLEKAIHIVETTITPNKLNIQTGDLFSSNSLDSSLPTSPTIRPIA
jgi:hypothetical protein